MNKEELIDILHEIIVVETDAAMIVETERVDGGILIRSNENNMYLIGVVELKRS